MMPVESMKPYWKSEVYPLYRILSLNPSGSSGIAPLCVQTYADTSTASLCASGTGFPLRMAEVKVAVKESPAPTVSATFTFGVSWKETTPGVKT